MTYTPRPGDTARDTDGEIWLIYADANDYTLMYAINAYYLPRTGGEPVETVAAKWGPLRLEHRPETR